MGNIDVSWDTKGELLKLEYVEEDSLCTFSTTIKENQLIIAT